MSSRIPVSTSSDKQNIMYCREKELIVVPLMDSKRQMIIVSKSKVDEEASKTPKGKPTCLSHIVRTLMKGIRASNIQKYE